MLNKDNLDVDRLYTSVWKLLRSNDDIYLVEDALEMIILPLFQGGLCMRLKE